MSEKRKPALTIVAQKRGKRKVRVELYPAYLWPDKPGWSGVRKRYRVRINRKWVWGDRHFTLSYVMSQLRQLLARRC